MEYLKKFKNRFKYECVECGHSFTRDYRVNPYTCRDCGIEYSFNEIRERIEIVKQYCPICTQYFETSEYLNQHVDDEHTRWLANMVTHYRHNHIISWDKSWGYNGHYYRKNWQGNRDYDELKAAVNERAKRQILRKCKDYMITHGFEVNHVINLRNTTQKTIDLYTKILGEKEHSCKKYTKKSISCQSINLI